MNVQSIIDRARKLWYVSSNQYTDSMAIEDFNIIYNQIVNEIITRVNEDFFRDELLTTTVDFQSEYNIDSRVDKIKKLFVKYGVDDEKFRPAREEFIDLLHYDLSWYKENQSKEDPFYVIADRSVFLCPAPLEWEWWGQLLKMTALLWATDLEITWVEEDILVPKNYHFLISEWMKHYIYQYRWLVNESNDAKAKFNEEISNMVTELSERNSVADQVNTPNLNYYE